MFDIILLIISAVLTLGITELNARRLYRHLADESWVLFPRTTTIRRTFPPFLIPLVALMLISIGDTPTAHWVTVTTTALSIFGVLQMLGFALLLMKIETHRDYFSDHPAAAGVWAEQNEET